MRFDDTHCRNAVVQHPDNHERQVDYVLSRTATD